MSEAWILKTLGFAILVGSVMALIEKSGGINGFVEYVHTQRALVNSPRSALLVSYVIGIFIFIESSIPLLLQVLLVNHFVIKRESLAQSWLMCVTLHLLL